MVLLIFSLLFFIFAIITIWAAWFLPNASHSDIIISPQDRAMICSFLFLVSGVACFTTHVIVSGF